MCGRIHGTQDGKLIWNVTYPDPWAFGAELAPTQDYPIIRKKPDTDDLEALLARWGLIPEHCQGEEDLKKYKTTFNARSETAHQKPTFRKAFQRQRCVVPVQGFYEWAKDGKKKTKVEFTSVTGGPLILAGLWDHWMGPQGLIHSFSILTCDAGQFMQPYHERQPVILGQKAARQWLDRGTTDQLQRLLVPCPDSWLQANPC